MTTPLCYLDYNAETPIKPAVVAAMAVAAERVGNPSSVHRHGRLARRAVEDARARVAALAGADPAGVVFTSGGTEANDLALGGVGRARLVVSAVEHDSVLGAAPGAMVIPVDGDGVVDLAALEATLAAVDAPALVSLMLANNETGVIQPVARSSAMAHAAGALLHCDAVQAVGRIAVDMAGLGVDLMSLSAHKMGGPQGVGALLLRDGLAIDPRLRGGGQESGRRAGSENAAGIVGFGAAATLAADDLADAGRVAGLRDAIAGRLRAIAPGARVMGAGAERLCNTVCVTMPGVASETQVMALDLAGVAVSAGSACSSGKVGRSHVLGAMGIDEPVASCAVRISLGWRSTAADVDRLIDAWAALYARAGVGRLASGAHSPAA